MVRLTLLRFPSEALPCARIVSFCAPRSRTAPRHIDQDVCMRPCGNRVQQLPMRYAGADCASSSPATRSHLLFELRPFSLLTRILLVKHSHAVLLLSAVRIHVSLRTLLSWSYATRFEHQKLLRGSFRARPSLLSSPAHFDHRLLVWCVHYRLTEGPHPASHIWSLKYFKYVSSNVRVFS